MTPLASLLAAVESNDDLAVDELRRAMASNAHDKGQIHYAHEIGRVYYRKDVNAAISLIGTMLPGWDWEVGCCSGYASAFLTLPGKRDETGKSGDICIWANSDTPARALLIALLRALVAKEDTQ